MHATLQKIAQDRRCIALMNMMKRSRNAVARGPLRRLTWISTDPNQAAKTTPQSAAPKDNIFTM